MPIQNRPISLRTALVAFLLASAPASAGEAGANAGWPTDQPIRTANGMQIPAGALGVVLIDAPRESTLLQLRGMIGSGVVILRSADARECLTLPIRFVAGDFGGTNISTHATRPIRLILQSPRIARALANGDDVVSDMYLVSSSDDDPDADIVIKSGMGESHGFVLNPGSSILADILGARTSRIACSKP